jgi:hypothetical protein
VFDYYERLGLGSHLYPGASLQSYLGSKANLAGSKKTVSIPVREVLPPELRKDMSAQQGSDVMWDITKEATPAQLHFGDVCAVGAPTSLTTLVTITWTKHAATPNGPITVITHVYAKNNASRVLTVNVSDAIRSGTTVLDTASAIGVDIPANTESLVLTHTTTVPSGTTNLNDIATATFVDKVTGVPIPGTLTATASASVTSSGVISNNTATIQDVENISGAGLKFSVAAPSIGTFAGYTAGDKTTGPVTWNSPTLSASGSVTFTKTIYLDSSGAGDESGTLSDKATLTGANGFTTDASASVAIDSTSIATLTVNKSISGGTPDKDVVFPFEVFKDSGVPDDPATPNVNEALGASMGTFNVTVLGGEATGKGTLGGLDDGNYWLVESQVAPYLPKTPVAFSVAAGACAVSMNVDNTFGPAKAQAVKTTVPAGGEVGWTMKLWADGVLIDSGTTALIDPTPGKPDSGDEYFGVVFGVTLDEGIAYTITEGSMPGWISGSGTGDCAFTVNYPEDADRLFSCSFENIKMATATVRKITVPAGHEAGWTFDLKDGNGAIIATKTTTGASAVDFGVYLNAGSYTVVEHPQAGWVSNGGVGCAFTVTYPADAGKTFTCVFTNTMAHPRLTPGYWKNHQVATTALLPQSLGDYIVDTFAEAKAVFNAMNCGKSGDQNAVGCLAGHLLAAELNVENGTDSCIAGTIADANAFLKSITYIGPSGTYDLTRAERAYAISLKTTLDNYNNNWAC